MCVWVCRGCFISWSSVFLLKYLPPPHSFSASNSHSDSKHVSPPSALLVCPYVCLSVCLTLQTKCHHEFKKNHSARLIKHLKYPTEQHELTQIVKTWRKMTALLSLWQLHILLTPKSHGRVWEVSRTVEAPILYNPHYAVQHRKRCSKLHLQDRIKSAAVALHAHSDTYSYMLNYTTYLLSFQVIRSKKNACSKLAQQLEGAITFCKKDFVKRLGTLWL